MHSQCITYLTFEITHGFQGFAVYYHITPFVYDLRVFFLLKKIVDIEKWNCNTAYIYMNMHKICELLCTMNIYILNKYYILSLHI